MEILMNNLLEVKNDILKPLEENELKENNYFLDIEVSSISFPRVNPTTTYKSKTWYEVSKNINGIIKKDAILTLPKNLDPNATYAENKYTEIKTYKESSVKMIIAYKLIDLSVDRQAYYLSYLDTFKLGSLLTLATRTHFLLLTASNKPLIL
jgi:hypothetical protein